MYAHLMQLKRKLCLERKLSEWVAGVGLRIHAGIQVSVDVKHAHRAIIQRSHERENMVVTTAQVNQGGRTQARPESLCLLLNHCLEPELFFPLVRDWTIAEAGIARGSREFFPGRQQRLGRPPRAGPAAVAKHAVVRWGQCDDRALTRARG